MSADNSLKRNQCGWLGVLIIFALLFLVYSPILPGNFLMDDHRLVKDENALVTGEMSPWTFWFQTDFTLSAVGWWLEWLTWGEHPAGYHVVNIVLQGLSAVLLWQVLRRLKIPGAWLAAVLFAVHPVGVNSVARIAELKNTLSLPFYLLSIWAYLRYESFKYPQKYGQSRAAIRAGGWYGLSLVAFVLALMSKTSTVMLPVVLLGCAAWQRRRITRQDWVQVSPFFVLALAFGLMSIWFQKHQALASAGQAVQPISGWQHLALAAHVICFYLGKALLPVHLNIIYARWKLDTGTELLPILFLAVVVALGWRFRGTWGRAVLFGLGCYMVTLFPVLGLFDSQFLVRWQVSDHLQYLPLMAPVVLIAAGWATLTEEDVSRGGAVILILVLSYLTFERARVFASQESLLRDTLAKNPTASEAHNDLGVILAKRKDYAGATEEFAAAVENDPNNSGAQSNLGQALAIAGKAAEGTEHLQSAVKLSPGDASVRARYANALLRQGKIQEAVVQFTVAQHLSAKPDSGIAMNLATIYFHTGNFHRAVEAYQKALAINPNSPEALNNLAWIQATCPDETVRDGAKAVEHAEAACRLTDYKQSGMISTLGTAYAEAGRFPEAIAMAEKAIQMETTNGETQFGAINRQLLMLYQAGKAYHEGAFAQP